MTFVSCQIPGETFFTNFECLDNTTPAMEVALTISLSYFVQDCLSVKAIFGAGKLTN